MIDSDVDPSNAYCPLALVRDNRSERLGRRPDIGLSWLPNAPSSLGQGRLTLLRYMAAGLPVVANPIGENRRMIVDGENGFLASTPREWADAVERLAADPSCRRRMGAAGRKLVEQHYQAQMWAGRFAQVVEATIHGQRISEETFSKQTALEPTLKWISTRSIKKNRSIRHGTVSTTHQATEKMGAGTSRSLCRSFFPERDLLETRRATGPIRKRTFGCGRVALLVLVGLLGCGSALKNHLRLPDLFQTPRGQLIVYSDFFLPTHHRLLEEMTARRSI